MLDPQAQNLLKLMADKGIAPVHTVSPADAREAYVQRRFATQNQPPEVAEVRMLSASGPHGEIPMRLYRPASAAATGAGALVYYHGGGWVIGDLDTHDTLCRDLALQAQCVVISVDYRLAPEHAFPAAVDDSIAAFKYVASQANDLGIDAHRIAVGGDSAGGNLAAVVSLVQRDAATETANAPQPCYQLLIYPATDMRAVTPSHQHNGQGYLLTSDTIKYFRGHYCPQPAQWEDWRTSPLLHPNLKGLPPALVLTAGYDPLRDEGLLYANALSENGNACQYVCFERQLHGFVPMGKVLDEANTAVSLCAWSLKKALA